MFLKKYGRGTNLAISRFGGRTKLELLLGIYCSQSKKQTFLAKAYSCQEQVTKPQKIFRESFKMSWFVFKWHICDQAVEIPHELVNHEKHENSNFEQNPLKGSHSHEERPENEIENEKREDLKDLSLPQCRQSTAEHRDQPWRPS